MLSRAMAPTMPHIGESNRRRLWRYCSVEAKPLHWKLSAPSVSACRQVGPGWIRIYAETVDTSPVLLELTLITLLLALRASLWRLQN